MLLLLIHLLAGQAWAGPCATTTDPITGVGITKFDKSLGVGMFEYPTIGQVKAIRSSDGKVRITLVVLDALRDIEVPAGTKVMLGTASGPVELKLAEAAPEGLFSEMGAWNLVFDLSAAQVTALRSGVTGFQVPGLFTQADALQKPEVKLVAEGMGCVAPAAAKD